MTELVDRMQVLDRWYRVSEELERMKKVELELRKEAFSLFFPTPEEGTNDFALPDSYVLKGVHKYNRNVKEPELNVLLPAFSERNIPVADLIQRKPTLVLSAYRKLHENNKENALFFDQCLEIKEGTPALEVVLPKRGR